MVSEELAKRVTSASRWLQNYEIDVVMYIFRERTTPSSISEPL
ncbi:unnamed protein product [Brassica napus]|uniref:(rape) hypothetical protein n=1 Tax=Brassica napus TaxID=3708 RepID=A0A816WNF5_BRANA|nr:unnamed protein product [Brassica napus]